MAEDALPPVLIVVEADTAPAVSGIDRLKASLGELDATANTALDSVGTRSTQAAAETEASMGRIGTAGETAALGVESGMERTGAAVDAAAGSAERGAVGISGSMDRIGTSGGIAAAGVEAGMARTSTALGTTAATAETSSVRVSSAVESVGVASGTAATVTEESQARIAASMGVTSAAAERAIAEQAALADAQKRVAIAQGELATANATAAVGGGVDAQVAALQRLRAAESDVARYSADVGTAGEAGASRLSSAFTKAGTSLSNFGIPFAGSLTRMGQSIDEASTKGHGLEAGLASLGKTALTVGAVGFVAVGAESIHAADQFTQATAQIASHADITVEKANEIGRAFLATAGTSIFSGTQMAQAFAPVSGQLGQMQGHALSAGQALQFLKATGDLAEATGGQLGTTTQTVANIMQAFQVPVKDVTTVTDQLFNTARVTGVGIDQLGSTVDRLKARMGVAAPTVSDMGALLVDLAEHGVTGSRGLLVVNTAVNQLLKSSDDVTKAQTTAQKSSEALTKAQQTLAAAEQSTGGATASATELRLQAAVATAQQSLATKDTVANQLKLQAAQEALAANGSAASAKVAAAQLAVQTATQNNTTAQQNLQAATSGTMNVTLQTAAGAENLALHIYNSQGAFVGLGNVIAQLQPALQGLTEHQQLAALTQVFGASANKALLDTVLAGPAAYDKAAEAVNRHGAAAAAAAKQSQTLHRELETIKAEVTDVADRFGLALIPKVQEAGHVLADTVGWFEKNKVAAEALAVVVGGVLSVAVAVFAEQKLANLGKMTQSAIKDVSSLVTWLGNLGKASTDAGAKQETLGVEETQTAAATSAEGAAATRTTTATVAQGEAAATTSTSVERTVTSQVLPSATPAIEGAAAGEVGAAGVGEAQATGAEALTASAEALDRSAALLSDAAVRLTEGSGSLVAASDEEATRIEAAAAQESVSAKAGDAAAERLLITSQESADAIIVAAERLGVAGLATTAERGLPEEQIASLSTQTAVKTETTLAPDLAKIPTPEAVAAVPASAETGLVPAATTAETEGGGILGGLSLGSAVPVALGGVIASQLYTSLAEKPLARAVGQPVAAGAGNVITDAGLGAAIGTVIEPGIGTAIGTGLGGLAGVLTSLFEHHPTPGTQAAETITSPRLPGIQTREVRAQAGTGGTATRLETVIVPGSPAAAVHGDNVTQMEKFLSSFQASAASDRAKGDAHAEAIAQHEADLMANALEKAGAGYVLPKEQGVLHKWAPGEGGVNVTTGQGVTSSQYEKDQATRKADLLGSADARSNAAGELRAAAEEHGKAADKSRAAAEIQLYAAGVEKAAADSLKEIASPSTKTLEAQKTEGRTPAASQDAKEAAKLQKEAAQDQKNAVKTELTGASEAIQGHLKAAAAHTASAGKLSTAADKFSFFATILTNEVSRMNAGAEHKTETAPTGPQAPSGTPPAKGAPSNVYAPLKLAAGGIVNEPTLAIVGEAGPEAVIPEAMLGPTAFAELTGGSTGVTPLPATPLARKPAPTPQALVRSASRSTEEAHQFVTSGQVQGNPTIQGIETEVGKLTGAAEKMLDAAKAHHDAAGDLKKAAADEQRALTLERGASEGTPDSTTRELSASLKAIESALTTTREQGAAPPPVQATLTSLVRPETPSPTPTAPTATSAPQTATQAVIRAETDLARATTQESRAVESIVPRETSLGVQTGNTERQVESLGTEVSRVAQVERQAAPVLQTVARAETQLAPAATEAVRELGTVAPVTETVVTRQQALGVETEAVGREIETLGTVVHRVEGEIARPETVRPPTAPAVGPSPPPAPAVSAAAPAWSDLLVASLNEIKTKQATLATDASVHESNATLTRLGALSQTATTVEQTVGADLSSLKADSSVGDAHLAAIDAASRLTAKSSDVRSSGADIVNALHEVLTSLQVLVAKPTSSQTQMLIDQLVVQANSPQQLQSTLAQQARKAAISSNPFAGANLGTGS